MATDQISMGAPAESSSLTSEIPFVVHVWRILSLRFLDDSTRAALGFSVRTLFAGLLALYVSFALELDEPQWSAITVWIVAQPAAGMAVSKSLYRMVGTLIGALAGIALIACFAQMPGLFIGSLALWIGLCVYVANILRNFRGYAAILAAITAVIVALAALPTPNQVFNIAVARATCNIVGIASAMVMAVLFSRFRAKGHLLAGLQQGVTDCFRRVKLWINESDFNKGENLEWELIPRLIALETMAEYAAAEAAEIRIHLSRIRSLLANLLGLLSISRSLHLSIQREGNQLPEECSASIGEVLDLLSKPRSSLPLDKIRALRSAVVRAEETVGAAETAVTRQAQGDLFLEFLSFTDAIFEDWKRIEGGWCNEPVVRLNLHRDHRLAVLNGLRATAAILFVGWFWILTAWSSGIGAVIITTVVVSLFSTLPQPDRIGWAFFKGTLAGCMASFFCTFFLLQNIDGNFVLFGICLGIFLIPAEMLAAEPKTVALGLSFCVLFLNTMAPSNPMNYDVVAFLNGTLASLFGVLVGIVSFQILFPRNLQQIRAYIRQRLAHSIRRLSRDRVIPSASDWRTLTLDRINRLHPDQPGNSEAVNRRFEMDLLAFGEDIYRLRHLEKDAAGNRVLLDLVEPLLKIRFLVTFSGVGV